MFNKDRSRRDGLETCCRLCKSKKSRDTYAKHSIEVIERRRVYVEQNYEGLRVARAKARDQLADWYVKKQLLGRSGISAKRIPTALVDLKREQLRLQRLAQQLEQAAREEVKR